MSTVKIYVSSNDITTDTKNKIKYIDELLKTDNASDGFIVLNLDSNMLHDGLQEAPIVEIDGKRYNYSDALKVL